MKKSNVGAEFADSVTERAIPPVEEVAISASAINNMGLGLLYQGVAALAQAGVIDLDEARKMIKKPPFTKMQQDRIKAVVRLHRDLVVQIPAAMGKWLVEVANS